MEAAFVNYRQEGLNTTIMMFDMDNFKVINDVMITPAISIGFSYFKDSDYSYEDALGRADLAMYKSKKQGKSTFNLYK